MNAPRLILFLGLLGSGLARADCPQIRGNTVLFGGHLSTTAEMQPCYPQLLVVGEDEWNRYLSCFVRQIDESEGQKFVVAGHSSGAAVAERLVQAVRDKSKVRLVLLEGYGNPASQRGVETTCWYAENGSRKGFNAPSMLDPAVCRGGAKAFEAPWCDTELCLHVSLVNLHAPAELDRKTVVAHAFDNCTGNVSWEKP